MGRLAQGLLKRLVRLLFHSPEGCHRLIGGVGALLWGQQLLNALIQPRHLRVRLLQQLLGRVHLAHIENLNLSARSMRRQLLAIVIFPL